MQVNKMMMMMMMMKAKNNAKVITMIAMKWHSRTTVGYLQQ